MRLAIVGLGRMGRAHLRAAGERAVAVVEPVARVRDEAIIFDLRTVEEGEYDDVVAAVREAQHGGVGTDGQSE